MLRRWILSVSGSGLAAAGRRPECAAAGDTATIRGQVVSLDNVPLSGITIAAYDQPNTTANRTPLTQTSTGADGRYSLTVPPGTIWVAMLTAERWGYDYTPISVKAGDVVDNVIFVPAIGATGRRTDRDSRARTGGDARAGRGPARYADHGAPAARLPLILVVAGALVLCLAGLALRGARRIRF